MAGRTGAPANRRRPSGLTSSPRQVSGPQVVNDSKTPSGTVHIGTLRGVVLHDAIRRAVAAARHRGEFRYGVDDLDPMDSQALLTPDAVERVHGRAARARAGAGGQQPHPTTRATSPTLFMETFAGLGIQPAALLDERALRRGRDGPVHRSARSTEPT